MKRKLLLFLSILLLFVSVTAQENLLKNPNADEESADWRFSGNAKVQETQGNKMFVLKYGGLIQQDILLPKNSAEKFVLLIGTANSNRVFFDDDITDHPYLYGYLMKNGSIQKYLLGQNTLWRSKIKDQWNCIWGIYEIPKVSNKVRFFLMQAARRGTSRNGSVARFDNLGLYIFNKQTEAETFTASYCKENFK